MAARIATHSGSEIRADEREASCHCAAKHAVPAAQAVDAEAEHHGPDEETDEVG